MVTRRGHCEVVVSRRAHVTGLQCLPVVRHLSHGNSTDTSGVTRRVGGRPPRVTPSRSDTRMKYIFFAAEFTKNSGQTTLEGGEGGIGDETTARTRNSSGDEIANVNFFYDDIVHPLKIQ